VKDAKAPRTDRFKTQEVKMSTKKLMADKYACLLFAVSVLVSSLLMVICVPGFIFADGTGSTSTGGGSTGSSTSTSAGTSTSVGCTCTFDNCTNDWGTGQWEEGYGCEQPPWDACDINDYEIACGTNTDKKYPKVTFWFEKEAPWCVWDKESARPSSIYWTRNLTVTAVGQTDYKTLSFKPKMQVSFEGFTNDGVCDESSGQIDFDLFFFASLTAWGSEVKDPNKNVTEPTGYGAGWLKLQRNFVKTGSDWKISAVGENDAKFEMSKTVSCPTTGDSSEKIQFDIKIKSNSGVAMGNGQQQAYVRFWCPDDTTACTSGTTP
jgi:hypothetical protein